MRDLEISGAKPDPITETHSERNPTSTDDTDTHEARPKRQAKQIALDRLTGIFLNEKEE